MISPAHFYAPVDLPHGAHVTKFVVYYEDNHPTENVYVSLERKDLGSTGFLVMSQFQSDDALPGVQPAEITEINYSQVDRQASAYVVFAMIPYGSEDGALGVESVRVDYAFSDYLPLTTKQ